MAAYVDYVVANHEGYLSLVKGAAGGNEKLREIYEEARSALTDRVFREDARGVIVPDTPAARLVVRGWSAMTEELVLAWVADPTGVTRDGAAGDPDGVAAGAGRDPAGPRRVTVRWCRRGGGQGDAAAVGVDDRLHQRQAEAGAAVGAAGAGGVGAGEALEGLVRQLRREPGPSSCTANPCSCALTVTVVPGGV